MSNAPRVLVINYDENGDYAKNHPQAKEAILQQIRSKTWDFIFLCTQKSLSNLISLSADTMQHVIGEEIKKNSDFSDYTLFSKIDATRPVNSKKVIFSNDKKFRNVRIRCWRNVKIPIPSYFNEMALKSTSYKGTEDSLENNYNTLQTINTTPYNKDIRIVRYKYKRITNKDESSRQKGEGAIIVSLILERYDETNKKKKNINILFVITIHQI
jgi:hypothetical protein